MKITMNLNRLIDIYPSWMISGIFTDLQVHNVPWKDKDISADLNIAYYGQHSGDKIISPFVEKFLSSDGSLNNESRAKIASAIYMVCGENWRKLWDTTIQEYDLLDNTNAYISETTTTEQNTDTTDNGTNKGTVTHAITGNDTTTDSGTVNHSITGNDTTTDSGTVGRGTTGTDTTTETGTIDHGTTGTDTTKETGTVSTEGTTGTDRTVNNDIYGFNSSDPSNADKQTGNDKTTASQTETRNLSNTVEHGTTETETRNLSNAVKHGTTETETRDLSNKVEHNTTDLETRDLSNKIEHNTLDTETRDLSDSRTGNEKVNGTITHETHRHGNIGVTTSQQMLQEERDLWQWYFYEYVFKDIDRFLTISVY